MMQMLREMSQEESDERLARLMKISESQGPKEKEQIREKYAELIEKAQMLKDADDIDYDSFCANMHEADALFQNVVGTREATYDARLTTVHSAIANKRVHAVESVASFNPSVFLAKLGAMLTGKVNEPEAVYDLSEANWLELGSQTQSLCNRPPKLNFLNGTFSEVAHTVKQQRKPRQKDTAAKTAVLVMKQTDDKSQQTDETFEEIQRVKKILHEEYKRLKGPICYFRFTFDPTSFARSIENMFHLAFLIKEFEVKLFLNEKGLPVIEPVINRGGSASSSSSAEHGNCIITMNKETWRKVVKKINLTTATIPPPQTAAESYSSRH